MFILRLITVCAHNADFNFKARGTNSYNCASVVVILFLNLDTEFVILLYRGLFKLLF